MKAVVVDLLNDSSDDEDEVQVVKPTKKVAKVNGNNSNNIQTAKTPAAAAALQRAAQQQQNAGLLSSVKKESTNASSLLSVRELKSRLNDQGIDFHDCIEKKDLVDRLAENGKAAAAPDNAAVLSVDPFGPLADGESSHGHGSKGNFTIKRTGQTYYCSCPSWKFQRIDPGSGRTCKHIDAMRNGYGQNHIGFAAGIIGKSKRASSTSTTNSRKKKAKTGEDDLITVTLAETYNPSKHDPTGHYLSEKLDGMRCVWDGRNHSLYSRNGNAIAAPAWFTGKLPPNFCLDGELFLDRERFQELMSVKGNPNDPRWSQVKLVVFDAPKVNGDFPARLRAVKDALARAKTPPTIAYLLEQTICHGKAHVEDQMDVVVAVKGEGVVLRNPSAPYEQGRTKNLLKVKRWKDAEAEVVGYTAGKGKHEGCVGALVCQMISSGKEFKIGTGFKDAEREKHLFPIGSRVTYTFQELTKDGIPRFPKYLRERPQE